MSRAVDFAAETHLYGRQYEDLRDRAHAQAAREDRSVASLLRVALREYLDRNEPTEAA